MAFGKTPPNTSNYGPNAKVYYASIRQKKDGKYLPEPIFEVKQKVGDSYEIVDGEARFVSGNLVEIRNKEGKNPKDGKVIRSVVATLLDGDQVCHVTIHHDYLGWNIINAFAALKDYNGVLVGLYQSKPKPNNPKTYASVAVRQGPKNDIVYGKVDNKDLPAIPRVKVGEDVHTDKTARTVFFIAQVDELAAILKAKAPTSVPVSSGTSTEAPEDDLGGLGDEIPETVGADGKKFPF